MKGFPQEKWLIAFALLLMAVSTVWVFDYQNLKSTWAYTTAKEKFAASPKLSAALGNPLEFGIVWSWKKSEKSATFTIPIKGPKSSAIGYVSARKNGGSWYFYRLTVHLSEERSIELQ